MRTTIFIGIALTVVGSGCVRDGEPRHVRPPEAEAAADDGADQTAPSTLSAAARVLATFVSQSTGVEWVEVNDRDPVGLPMLRWKYRLDESPFDPVLQFEYAGAETEATALWTWDTLVTQLPSTGGDEVFHPYEVAIDPSLLRVGDNFISFVSGYIDAQNEADGVLLRNVRLIDRQ